MTSSKNRRLFYKRKHSIITKMPRTKSIRVSQNGGGNCFNPAYMENGSGFPNASMYIPYNELQTQLIPLPARGGGGRRRRRQPTSTRRRRQRQRHHHHHQSRRRTRRYRNGGGVFDFQNNVQYNYDTVSNILQGSNVSTSVTPPFPFSQPNLLNR